MITLTIHDPGVGWLTANQREHHHPRAVRIAAWRDAGAWAGKAARLPMLGRARIVATICPRGSRVRDANNWAPTAKAIVDGIVREAGLLLPDDDYRHLIGPDLRIGEPVPKGEPLSVVLTIHDLSNEPEGTK